MSQSSELTTRDVLQQVDRRLELIEGDVRNLHQEMNARFAAQDGKMDARFVDQDGKIDVRFAAQDVKFENRFRWTIGLILMSWMSTMGAILFRLGPITQ